MPRNLGYFHSYENCYFSTYGRDTALLYGERYYCIDGIRYRMSDNQPDSARKCQDWYRCKGLNQVGKKPKKRVRGL